MTDETATMRRPAALQVFLDALFPCFAESTRANAADTAFVAHLAERLHDPGQFCHRGSATRMAVLDQLDAALAGLEAASPSLRRLGAAFAALAPAVPWSKRRHDGPDAERFAQGHGNALLVGPGGAEQRADMRIGVSLMAPRIRYPDHSHPPDELYLVLSDGEWRQGAGDWVRPGVGGTVRNPPGIVHAMRAGETPLLAVWGLIV